MASAAWPSHPNDGKTRPTKTTAAQRTSSAGQIRASRFGAENSDAQPACGAVLLHDQESDDKATKREENVHAYGSTGGEPRDGVEEKYSRYRDGAQAI
jgi:hypothetical protein